MPSPHSLPPSLSSSLFPLTASEEGEWMDASTITPRFDARSLSEVTTLSAMTLREGGKEGGGREGGRVGGE